MVQTSGRDKPPRTTLKSKPRLKVQFSLKHSTILQRILISQMLQENHAQSEVNERTTFTNVLDLANTSGISLPFSSMEPATEMKRLKSRSQKVEASGSEELFTTRTRIILSLNCQTRIPEKRASF